VFAEVLIDIAHMRQDSLDATFALLDELDGATAATPWSASSPPTRCASCRRRSPRAGDTRANYR
jgi:hypothetical protein